MARCEQKGNGLCPVLTPCVLGDETGSCGGEREDGRRSLLGQSSPANTGVRTHTSRVSEWWGVEQGFNAISTLPSTLS